MSLRSVSTMKSVSSSPWRSSPSPSGSVRATISTFVYVSTSDKRSAFHLVHDRGLGHLYLHRRAFSLPERRDVRVLFLSRSPSSGRPSREGGPVQGVSDPVPSPERHGQLAFRRGTARRLLRRPHLRPG